MIRQISVFAENKPGKVERITRVLASAGINIRAVLLFEADPPAAVLQAAGYQPLSEADLAN